MKFNIDIKSNIEIEANSAVDTVAVGKVFAMFHNEEIKAPSIKILMEGSSSLLQKIEEICYKGSRLKSHGIRFMTDRRYMLFITRR